MLSAGPFLKLDAFSVLALALFGFVWLASNHPLAFWLGWTVSSIPLLRSKQLRAGSRLLIALGAVSLGGGLLLLARNGYLEWAFALIMLAVAQRKGFLPLHSCLVDSFEKPKVSSAALIFNTHLGAACIARLHLFAYPEISGTAVAILADLGLLTAVIAAVAAVAEKRPRRLLAFVSISQSATILAGLESGNGAATTGAMMHWIVVALTTTALLSILRLMEVRESVNWDEFQRGGLAGAYPRFAIFFAIAALALVGLPGTLGFVSEDLLLHGALESHPWIGLAIPVATALNAVTLFRLFARIFLGSRKGASSVIPDATVRERVPLTLIAITLVVLGLFPRIAIGLHDSS